MNKQAPTDLSDRLAKALSFSGLTQSEAGRRARLSRSAISKWLSGENQRMLPDRAQRLAGALGVRPEYLLLLDDEMTVAEGATPKAAKAAHHDDGQVVIPRLLRIAAGVAEYSPLDGKNNLVMERRMVEKLVGPVPAADPSRVVFAADVHGDSMAPLINDKDILIVQKFYPVRTAGQPLIENGKLYVLNLTAIDDETDGDARASVKRLSMGKGHELHILSDNPHYPPRVVDMRRVRFIQAFILGRPVNLIRAL